MKRRIRFERHNPLGDFGETRIAFEDERITIEVSHPGAFVEQLPLLLPTGEKPEIHAGHIQLPGSGVEVAFSPECQAKWHREREVSEDKTLVTLALSANDTLRYELRMKGDGP